MIPISDIRKQRIPTGKVSCPHDSEMVEAVFKPRPVWTEAQVFAARSQCLRFHPKKSETKSSEGQAPHLRSLMIDPSASKPMFPQGPPPLSCWGRTGVGTKAVLSLPSTSHQLQGLIFAPLVDSLLGTWSVTLVSVPACGAMPPSPPCTLPSPLPGLRRKD